eukprot:scaffold5754_cov66-Skeletonema_marinoi.AAC.2
MQAGCEAGRTTKDANAKATKENTDHATSLLDALQQLTQRNCMRGGWFIHLVHIKENTFDSVAEI